MTRPFRVAVVLAALVVGWLLAPTSIGGAQTYVTTYGTSMEPGFHAGDLGVLHTAGDYAVGDVVGYRSATLAAVVLHRIVARDGDAFVMKGDNNTWPDVDRPTAGDVVGRLVLRVPHGGLWFGWLFRSPAGILAVAGAVVLAGLLRSRGGAARRQGRFRRRRRLRRSPLPLRWAALRSPSERQSAGLTGGAALIALGAVLLGLAAFGPVTRSAASSDQSPRTMTFSYAATVPGTPAFDGTTISSPDPVFRRLADTVIVHYAYRGEPGSIRVGVELHGPSGWHSTMPLPPAGGVGGPGPSSGGDLRLDLDALDRRARAAAAATGSGDDQVGVRIVVRVSLAGGQDFTAALPLILTRQQLSVPDAGSLVVKDAPSAPAPGRAASSISVVGRELRVGTAQRVAQLLLGLGALLAGLAAAAAVRGHPPDQLTAVRRRYGRLLVPTGPVDPPSGRPVVEVAELATLARLARSYGLLVMHWQDAGATVFAVWDDTALYRFHLPAPTRSPTSSHRLARRAA